MGACASKPNVLKEEGINAPLTREVEPTETSVVETNLGDDKGKDVKEAETLGGDGDEGEKNRQSLEVLLKAVEATESSASTEQTKTIATSGDEKALVMMETKTEAVAEQPTEKVESKSVPVAVQSKTTQPVEKVEKSEAVSVLEKPVAAHILEKEESKTIATQVKESSTVVEVEIKPVSTTIKTV